MRVERGQNVGKTGGFAGDPPGFADKCMNGFRTPFICNPVQKRMYPFWNRRNRSEPYPFQTRRNPGESREIRGQLPSCGPLTPLSTSPGHQAARCKLQPLAAKPARSRAPGARRARAGAPGAGKRSGDKRSCHPGAGRGRHEPGGPQGDKRSCQSGKPCRTLVLVHQAAPSGPFGYQMGQKGPEPAGTGR